MDYTTLTHADQATVLRDTLRGLETDHLRLSAMVDAGLPGATQDRVAELEAGIAHLKKQVDALDTKAAKERK